MPQRSILASKHVQRGFKSLKVNAGIDAENAYHWQLAFTRDMADLHVSVERAQDLPLESGSGRNGPSKKAGAFATPRMRAKKSQVKA